MTIISCNQNCKYQKGGYCGLSSASSVTDTTGTCAYFVKKKTNFNTSANKGAKQK